jgi:hypothetical protein
MKKVTVVDAGKEVESMANNPAHRPDWGEGVPVPVNDCGGYEEVAQVAKFSKEVVVFYFHVHPFGLIGVRFGQRGALLLE